MLTKMNAVYRLLIGGVAASGTLDVDYTDGDGIAQTFHLTPAQIVSQGVWNIIFGRVSATITNASGNALVVPDTQAQASGYLIQFGGDLAGQTSGPTVTFTSHLLDSAGAAVPVSYVRVIQGIA